MVSSLYFKRDDIQRKILKQARNKKEIVYGAQSIRKQLGYRARETKDYDLYAKNPKAEARRIEKKLDKTVHANQFYTSKGGHKGTYRVKFIGKDGKARTADDESVADYTKMPSPRPPYKVINGVRYRTLRAELKAKERIVKDAAYAYRHMKDKRDVATLRRAIRAERKPNWRK